MSADTSLHGLGAILIRKQRKGEKQPVAYISRAITKTEQMYAQIENEALVKTWACDRL